MRGKKVSAQVLRQMPEGTRVILHGRDRRGYSTELECVLVKTGRGKGRRLRYYEIDGIAGYKPINKLDGAVHWYEVLE